MFANVTNSGKTNGLKSVSEWETKMCFRKSNLREDRDVILVQLSKMVYTHETDFLYTSHILIVVSVISWGEKVFSMEARGKPSVYVCF